MTTHTHTHTQLWVDSLPSSLELFHVASHLTPGDNFCDNWSRFYTTGCSSRSLTDSVRSLQALGITHWTGFFLALPTDSCVELGV